MKKIILNNKLEAGSTPHRAVLLREPADEYAPNGNGDIIAIEQKFNGEWRGTPGHWYAETLLGTDGDGDDERPSDGISIQGDEWVVEAGMVDALRAYVRILIDEGSFMTDERKEIVAYVRKNQKEVFGKFYTETPEEYILSLYPKWGAA